MALILVNPSWTQECPATKNAHAIGSEIQETAAAALGKNGDRQWYVREQEVPPESKDNAIVWMVQTGKDEDGDRQWYELAHPVCQRLERMYIDVKATHEQFVP